MTTINTKLSFAERFEQFVEDHQSFDFPQLETYFGKSLSTRQKLICTSMLRNREDIHYVYHKNPATGQTTFEFHKVG